MSAAVQQAFVFHDPLEPRVLPHSGWPWWTLNTQEPGHHMRQKPFRLNDLGWVLAHIPANINCYMSQGFFSRPRRVAMHVAWLTHAFLDLDLYKLTPPLDPRSTAVWLRQYCADEGIPTPSVIIYSGRGLYLKWFWSSPIPRAAAGRAVAVNKSLVKKFTSFGADPQAVDVSRILRVVGSVNSKSGEQTEILWQEERDGEVLTYDFELFADELLRYTGAEIRDIRANRAKLHVLSSERAKRQSMPHADGKRKPFTREDWHWGCLEDIRCLVERRWDGVVPEGWRGTIGHLGACQIAMVVPGHRLWPEIQAWAQIILPTDYAGGEFQTHCSTLLENAKAAARGEKSKSETFKDRTPIYTYRSSSLIDRLQITQDEMVNMTRLIDGTEKARRLLETRRANGMVSRSEYEAKAAARQGQVVEMRARGLTIKAIGAELGIAVSHVRRLMGATEG
jgi:hypothetical protein